MGLACEMAYGSARPAGGLGSTAGAVGGGGAPLAGGIGGGAGAAAASLGTGAGVAPGVTGGPGAGVGTTGAAAGGDGCSGTAAGWAWALPDATRSPKAPTRMNQKKRPNTNPLGLYSGRAGDASLPPTRPIPARRPVLESPPGGTRAVSPPDALWSPSEASRRARARSCA